MNLDYMIPLLTGVAMLAVPIVLLAIAWQRRIKSVPLRHSKPHTYRTAQRQAYSLSRVRVYACLVVSLFAALVAGLGMAVWLPLAPAENSLLATLIAPLLWAAVLVYLLMCTRWKRDSVLTLTIGVSALAAVSIPLVTG